MTVSRKTAKKLLYDFMFESDSAQEWVDDVWGLSPFLGQSAANAAEVIGALIETCSERQLNTVVASIHADHAQSIRELKSAPEWRVQLDAKTATVAAETPPGQSKK